MGRGLAVPFQPSGWRPLSGLAAEPQFILTIQTVHCSRLPDVRLDGESSLELLLEYDELRLADVPPQDVDLAVDRPRQLLLDRLRLAAGQRHLAPEPGVRIEDLSGSGQREADLDAGRARLLHADGARRPRRPLRPERVRLIAVRPVRERRLKTIIQSPVVRFETLLVAETGKVRKLGVGKTFRDFFKKLKTRFFLSKILKRFKRSKQPRCHGRVGCDLSFVFYWMSSLCRALT